MDAARLSDRVWPQFLEHYREGGDNIAEMFIAGFVGDRAENLYSLVRRYGWIMSATDFGETVDPAEFAATLRAASIRDPNDVMVTATLCWDACELWLFCTSSGNRRTLDLELMYKGAMALLSPNAPEQANFERFRWFVSIGLAMAAAGNARSVQVSDWPIL